MSLTTDLLDTQLATLWRECPEFRTLRATAIAQLTQHGDAARWSQALAALPDTKPAHAAFATTVTIGEREDIADVERTALEAALGELHPWRKGPFCLFGVLIDAEWRSDLKWQRIAPYLQPLAGRRVLDVGCGNGYYGWRMCASGASLVVGVEANPVHVMQHLTMCRYLVPMGHGANCVLPLRFELLPPEAPFDTVFSLGVLYHQRSPAAHLDALRSRLRSGGELVLETLVMPGASLALRSDERYARMRNVSCVPNETALAQWLADAGFQNVRRVDMTATTTAEQRRTPWMRFESLADALDPTDPARTVEGHAAPLRAVMLAQG